jgi:putative ABC transport system permease protein
VFLLVVRDGMCLVLIGTAIGLGAAVVGARSVSAFLYGIPPTDVPAFAGAIALLVAVAFVACALPARRAIRVDPITTLRQE